MCSQGGVRWGKGTKVIPSSSKRGQNTPIHPAADSSVNGWQQVSSARLSMGLSCRPFHSLFLLVLFFSPLVQPDKKITAMNVWHATVCLDSNESPEDSVFKSGCVFKNKD